MNKSPLRQIRLSMAAIKTMSDAGKRNEKAKKTNRETETSSEGDCSTGRRSQSHFYPAVVSTQNASELFELLLLRLKTSSYSEPTTTRTAAQNLYTNIPDNRMNKREK